MFYLTMTTNTIATAIGLLATEVNLDDLNTNPCVMYMVLFHKFDFPS